MTMTPRAGLWREAGFRAPDHRWLEEALAQLMVCRLGRRNLLSTRDGELRIYRGELYCLSRRDRCRRKVWPGRGS